MAYTLPRGRRAPVVSQQDQENAARAREAAAAHSARTGGRPLGGGAVASPAVLDPQTQAMMQQLLANPGAIPGRNVNADTVASATPAQLAGELAGRQDYLKLQPIMAQELERQEAEKRRAAEVGVLNSVLGGGGAGAGMGAGGGGGAGVGRPVTLPQVGAAPLPLPSTTPGRPVVPGGAASTVPAPDRNLGIAAAAGPNISTMPFLPAGSVGYERPGGAYVVEGAPGSAPLVLGSEREAQRYFAGSTSPVDPAANRPSLPSPTQIDPALAEALAQGAAAGMPQNLGLEYARGMAARGEVPDLRQVEALSGLTPKPASRVGTTVKVAGQDYVYTQEGNLSPVARPDVPKPERGTQLNQLVREREAWKAEGRDDVVAQYDALIGRMGQESGIDTAALVAALAGKPATPAAGAKPAAAAPASAATPAKPVTAAKPAAEPAEQPRAPSANVPKAEGARVRQNGKLYEMRVGKWTEVSE